MRDGLFYRPVIHAVIFRSRFDFCGSEYDRQLEDLLRAERDGARVGEVENLRRFCQSEFGRPPA
jgi:hypothetical protein